MVVRARPICRSVAALAFGVLILFLCVLVQVQARAQQSDEKIPAARQSGAPLQSQSPLKVASNVVLVRVVVRDAQGKPVEGLRKEDFKVFDRGKEQTITQFEVESPAAAVASPENPANAPATTQAGSAMPEGAASHGASPKPPVVHGKFIAFYFDDINTSDADMIYARDAADRYLAEGLQAGDRVAIFTSEKMLADFTSDAQQIHDALRKLHSSSRSLVRNHDCPDLSDYQALQITQDPSNKYSDAWQAALDEAAHCDSGSAPQSPSAAAAPIPNGPPAAGNAGGGAGMGSVQQASGDAAGVVLQKARIMVDQIEMQARSSLQQIEQAVKYVSQMPGQRTFILVSPGFLAQSDQYQLDQIVDRALRAQVVINSLDPKGLAILLRESDASRAHVPDGAALRAAHSIDSQQELVATSVLADVAEGTGGQFFHNSNDLKGGFGLLAETPFYYTLAFAPSDIKPDGKFHELKVTLREKEKGVSIQARRGYFGPKNNGPGVTDAKAPQAASNDAAILEEVREVILSKADIAQLPVELVVKVSDTPGTTREVSLSSHLDTKSLQFSKDGDMNLNTVTFFFSVFDQKDNLIESQMRRARISVPDERVAMLFKVGLDVNLSLQLKPGTYRIREVVVESEEHYMAAFSRDVTVP